MCHRGSITLRGRGDINTRTKTNTDSFGLPPLRNIIWSSGEGTGRLLMLLLLPGDPREEMVSGAGKQLRKVICYSGGEFRWPFLDRIERVYGGN